MASAILRQRRTTGWVWAKTQEENEFLCLCVCVSGLLGNKQGWDYRERRDCQELGFALMVSFHVLILPTRNLTPPSLS